jgi:cell division protein FtsL
MGKAKQRKAAGMKTLTIGTIVLCLAIGFIGGSVVTVYLCDRKVEAHMQTLDHEMTAAAASWRARTEACEALLKAKPEITLDTVKPGGCGIAMLSEDGQSIYIQGMVCPGAYPAPQKKTKPAKRPSSAGVKDTDTLVIGFIFICLLIAIVTIAIEVKP